MDKTQYKGILVFAEQREGVIQNVAFELIGKARDLADQINEQVTAILCGYQVKGLSDQLIHAGADRVLVVDDPNLKDYLTSSTHRQSIISSPFTSLRSSSLVLPPSGVTLLLVSLRVYALDSRQTVRL